MEMNLSHPGYMPLRKAAMQIDIGDHVWVCKTSFESYFSITASRELEASETSVHPIKKISVGRCDKFSPLHSNTATLIERHTS